MATMASLFLGIHTPVSAPQRTLLESFGIADRRVHTVRMVGTSEAVGETSYRFPVKQGIALGTEMQGVVVPTARPVEPGSSLTIEQIEEDWGISCKRKPPLAIEQIEDDWGISCKRKTSLTASCYAAVERREAIATALPVAQQRIRHMATVERRSAIAAALPAAVERLQLMTLEDDPMFLDEAAALQAAAFPLSEDELVLKTKTFLFFNQGIDKPSLLAEDFAFMGPVVGGDGGLPKAEFLAAVGGFKLKDAFPDLNPRFHHFRADPLDPGRVWFTSQASGTDLGGLFGAAPTNKTFETPPQACSVKFDERGLVVKFTIGHVMERSIGNTGGLGGIFGPLYAIGRPFPFPEAQPWKPSKRYRLFQFLGSVISRRSQ